MAGEAGVPATDKTISVVIVDDHPLYRKGLRSEFDTGTGIKVIGEFATATVAVREVLRLRPSVVLMDLRLPWTPGARKTYCGAQAIMQILKSWPEARIAVITMFDDDKERVHEAMKAGARSYVSKAGPPHEMVVAVRLTALGHTFLHKDASDIVADLIPLSTNGFTAFSELTTRENQLLALAAAGHTNKEVSDRLNIKSKTIDNYWTNIRQKLGVPNRQAAIELAQSTGQSQPDCGPGETA